ncbi:NnrU family protein [Ottowia sp. VDI28]|uniref:NnrU family protein n=1 Tax=Ottowia sp. VDI28 TaxID=3133968 RepID=UPI003C2D178E
MSILILGLILFLGVHSARIFAEDWRTQTIARVGEKRWKGIYTLISLAGFALIIWGFGFARQQPVVWWTPPTGLRHLNALFTLVAFILIAAAYVPRNQIKAKLHHPMILGVKLWAFGHLLATRTLADTILFGAFLVWAILAFRAARQRDRAQGITYPAGTLGGTLTTVVAGVVIWAVFAFWLHALLIGIAPLGR